MEEHKKLKKSMIVEIIKMYEDDTPTTESQ